MSLIEIVDRNQIQQIQNKIKKDCVEFSQLNPGSKAKAADQLYTENRVLKEFGVAAVETIERMDEEIELEDNKVKILTKELKNSIIMMSKKSIIFWIKIQLTQIIKKRICDTLSISYK
jgi:predicted metallopeptidase